MLWKSGPIPMCQFMWYTPGTGKGAAGPYIETVSLLYVSLLSAFMLYLYLYLFVPSMSVVLFISNSNQ